MYMYKYTCTCTSTSTRTMYYTLLFSTCTCNSHFFIFPLPQVSFFLSFFLSTSPITSCIIIQVCMYWNYRLSFQHFCFVKDFHSIYLISGLQLNYLCNEIYNMNMYMYIVCTLCCTCTCINSAIKHVHNVHVHVHVLQYYIIAYELMCQ